MGKNKRVGAIIIKDEKILLMHRIKNGNEYWVIIGGGVEENESNEEALRREIKEETNLELLDYKFLGIYDEDDDRDHYYFKCVVSDGILEIGGPEKEENNKDNVYVLEWVLITDLDKTNLYPLSAKQYLK